MAMYRMCPDCGAALDPGEQCECQKEKDTTAPAIEKAQKKAEVHSYCGYRRVGGIKPTIKTPRE